MYRATADDPRCARVRAAVAAVRRAEHRLLETVAELHDGDAVVQTGYRNTAGLLADLTRIDPTTSQRLLQHSELLVDRVSHCGEELPARLPHTAAAHAEGAISTDHVRVIDRAMGAVARVPDLASDTVADAEALLAEQARQLAPRGLQRVADRLLAHLDPDGVAPLDPPEPDDDLSLATRRRDGALAITALIHGAVDADTVREVLDALSTPAGPDDTRPLGQRRAEALIELFTRATAPDGPAETPEPEGTAEDEQTPEPEPAESGSGPGPVRAPGRPLLMVTIDEQRLRLQVGHGLLDSDRTVSAAEARRLGCDAGIVPVVLGGASQPLDVGRLAYTVPDGMRRALHHRDRGCTFPGCDRRPRRCHAHHVRHWCDGGKTKIDNLTLLCRYHHHLLHHDDWEIRMVAGLPWYTPPAWIDPTRTPRPGGPHPLPDPP